MKSCTKGKINTVDIAGYTITGMDRIQCVNQILSWILSGEKQRYFVCANPHSLEVANHQDEFRIAISEADLVTPDGSGIVIASKILKDYIQDRVTGSDIFYGLNKKLNQLEGYTCFFLGSTDEKLACIREKMAKEFPALKVVGTYSPPFKASFSQDDNDRMIAAVNAVKPDVLWVGMTAPKQEVWTYQNRHHLDVKFIGPVGAVFDFFIGAVKRSSPTFHKLGLEWLPRLVQEPVRLWERMFVSAPKFMLRVVVQRMRKN